MPRPRPGPSLPDRLRPGARLAAAAAVLAAVLVLHALLLGGLHGTAARPPGERATGPAPLQVRQLSLAAPAQAAAPGSPEPLPAQAAVARRPGAVALPEPAASAAAPFVAGASVAASGVAAASVASAPPAGPPTASAQAATGTGAPGAGLAEAGGEPPRYATQLPPAATLQFAARREGRDSAGLQAELRWRPEAAGYTLTLGFEHIGWASVGTLDGDGLAPLRHVETRRGRELRAANFRREAGPGGGRITYSGPSLEHPLWPGAQDRLSWLVQLAAVLQADPGLSRPGAEVVIFVSGVRGDAAWWRFVAQGHDAVALADGTVADAVRLRREPQQAWDTEAEVWLDPARHHLPVRLTLRHGAATALELRLLQLHLP